MRLAGLLSRWSRQLEHHPGIKRRQVDSHSSGLLISIQDAAAAAGRGREKRDADGMIAPAETVSGISANGFVD